MAGTLIFVSGLSGAGKTTLIRAAMEQISDLSYLRTVTTRPPRQGETNGIEYQFVTESEYEAARAGSAQWDHSEYQGYKYGADVAEIKACILAGGNVICSIAPSAEILAQMKHLFGAESATVWIDTPAAIANARIASDALRSARSEDTSLRENMQYVFTPVNQLANDISAFITLINLII